MENLSKSPFAREGNLNESPFAKKGVENFWILFGLLRQSCELPCNDRVVDSHLIHRLLATNRVAILAMTAWDRFATIC